MSPYPYIHAAGFVKGRAYGLDSVFKICCVKHILTCERAKNMGLFTQRYSNVKNRTILTRVAFYLLILKAKR